LAKRKRAHLVFMEQQKEAATAPVIAAQVLAPPPSQQLSVDHVVTALNLTLMGSGSCN
jgi:hypothetical protein